MTSQSLDGPTSFLYGIGIALAILAALTVVVGTQSLGGAVAAAAVGPALLISATVALTGALVAHSAQLRR